jgi:membrane protein DedA with SNARE-associated domain
MESWISELAQHGYSILFAGVFLEAIGLPVPAALILLIAGGAAANGTLQSGYALSGAVVVTLAGDTLMFLLGRYTGWWLLGLLCRISLNPESCVLRAADAFYRRGRMLLVLAKFIPGINTMAPPLAGSMNMRFWPFIQLDLAGSVLYVGTCFGIGFIFSGALTGIDSRLRGVWARRGLEPHRADIGICRLPDPAVGEDAQTNRSTLGASCRGGTRDGRRCMDLRCPQSRIFRRQGNAHPRFQKARPQRT